MPFVACFFGALAYDIFIYTGDSPLNNGAWSFSNLQEGVKNVWHTILARFGRGPRTPESDEESLGAKQGQRISDSTHITGKEERHPSSSSLQGNNSRKPEKEDRADVNEANPGQNEEGQPQYKFKNTQKAGYHGEPWEKTEKNEKTEKSSENRQNQGSEGQRKDLDDKSREPETQQPDEETATQNTEADENLEEKKDKETGYDNPDRDTEENDVGGVDSRGK